MAIAKTSTFTRFERFEVLRQRCQRAPTPHGAFLADGSEDIDISFVLRIPTRLAHLSQDFPGIPDVEDLHQELRFELPPQLLVPH